MHNPHHKVVH